MDKKFKDKRCFFLFLGLESALIPRLAVFQDTWGVGSTICLFSMEAIKRAVLDFFSSLYKLLLMLLVVSNSLESCIITLRIINKLVHCYYNFFTLYIIASYYGQVYAYYVIVTTIKSLNITPSVPFYKSILSIWVVPNYMSTFNFNQ